ncbi:MAG: hypothetical protein IJ751_10705 [Oscillospiraceae bacterium]|nr:hypothetical protein [Oscillospiraceae bacterium]
MSSAESRLSARRRETRPYLIALTRCLGGFLALNLILLFAFRGSLIGWLLVAALEAALLGIDLGRAHRRVRETRLAREAATEAAIERKDASLNADELRQLAKKLDLVDVRTLNDDLATAGGREVRLITEAINAMLDRIDERYQAQVRFTSDASHELRTPIAVIQSYADLLDRWGKEDPQILQEGIEAICRETQGMSNLVNQLLFLVRGDKETQHFEPQAVDLTALATAVARETALIAQEYHVEAEIDSGVTATADPELVKECLRILCDNAVKYTPEGGTITLGLTRDGAAVRLSVRDTGVGIAPEDIPRLFDRFFRADSSRSRNTGGTGLGLSIAHWIAQRHGGHIDVTSAPGAGSTFTLVLPLHPPAAP